MIVKWLRCLTYNFWWMSSWSWLLSRVSGHHISAGHTVLRSFVPVDHWLSCVVGSWTWGLWEEEMKITAWRRLGDVCTQNGQLYGFFQIILNSLSAAMLFGYPYKRRYKCYDPFIILYFKYFRPNKPNELFLRHCCICFQSPALLFFIAI